MNHAQGSNQKRFLTLLRTAIERMESANDPQLVEDIIGQLRNMVQTPGVNVSEAIVAPISNARNQYLSCMMTLINLLSSRQGPAYELFSILLNAMRPEDMNKRSAYGTTMIIDAITTNAPLEVIDALLEHGANVNLGDRDGKTPLIHAASRGRVDLVNTLLRHGANMDQGDHSGKTAFMYAAIQGHLPILTIFMENGVNIDLQDHSGETALIHAARWPNQQEVVQFLLAQGAEPHLTDKEGLNVWDYANEGMLQQLRPYFPNRSINGNNGNNQEGGSKSRRSKSRRSKTHNKHRRRTTIRRSKTHRRIR